MKRVFVTSVLAAFCAGTVAFADQSPAYKGPLSPSEAKFVSAIRADLMHRFPKAGDAVKAGYIRYTNEDETGAISYANMHWTSSDIRHPSQLWYDTSGNLLGADFSVPFKAGGKRPNLFGVNPGRWYEFDDHIHWVNKSGGKSQYDNYAMAGKFMAAGGSVMHPTAATLVKMHRVKDASQVARIFDMPGIWDLIVWMKPNPKGAFAGKNPLVKP